MKKIFIDKSEWITLDKLSKFEMTNILAKRAEQIARDNISTLTTEEMQNLPDDNPALEIARRELRYRKCPLYVDREIGIRDNCIFVERRNPNEMI